jgi:hypothetical protein
MVWVYVWVSLTRDALRRFPGKAQRKRVVPQTRGLPLVSPYVAVGLPEGRLGPVPAGEPFLPFPSAPAIERLISSRGPSSFGHARGENRSGHGSDQSYVRCPRLNVGISGRYGAAPRRIDGIERARRSARRACAPSQTLLKIWTSCSGRSTQGRAAARESAPGRSLQYRKSSSPSMDSAP